MKTRFIAALFLCLPLVVRAVPADYKAVAGYGTTMGAHTEIVIDTVTLAGETNEPGGTVLLSFNATLHNSSIGYQWQVQVGLEAGSSNWPVELVNAFVVTADLTPNGGPMSTPTPVSLRVAATNSAAVKASVLAKEHVYVSSVDLFQFKLPPVAVDAVTEGAFTNYMVGSNDTFTVHFYASTPLLSSLTTSNLLLENPAGYHLFRPLGGGGGGLSAVINCGDIKPPGDNGSPIESHFLEITSVTTEGLGYRVTGIRRKMSDVLAVSYFSKGQMDAYDMPVRDPYVAPIGISMYTATEMVGRGEAVSALLEDGNTRNGKLADLLGLFALHYSFNDAEIFKGITLDGEFVLQAINVHFDVRLVGLTPVKLGITLTSRAEVTMRLTADAGVANDGGPLFEKEKQIATAPLPTIVLPIGEVPITITPVLTLKVGASLNATTRITVPVQASVEGGYYMAWDSTKPTNQSPWTYEPVHHEVQPHISDPTLAEGIGLEASAWVQGGLQLVIEDTYGPHIDVRTTATFGLHPFDDPWWTIDGDLTLLGGMAFKLLGVTVADPTTGFFEAPHIFTFDAGGPLIPPGPTKLGGNPATDPLSNVGGDHVRWARSVKWAVDGPASASVARVAGTPEDTFIAMHTPIDFSILMRVNGYGDLIWSKGFFFQPISLASTPDGGFVVMGLSGGLFLSKYDGDGNLNWSTNYTLLDDETAHAPQFIIPRKVMVKETSPGQYDIYVAGHRASITNTLNSDPFLAKFNSTGAQQWAKHYSSADSESVADAILLHNGDILFCGLSSLSPDQIHTPGPGASGGGWLMRVANDGSFKWASRTFAGLGMSWASATEDPDGNLFLSGNLFNTVVYTQPSLQVGKYTTNGLLLTMSTLCELAPYDFAQYPDDSVIFGILAPEGPNQTADVPGGMIDYMPDSGYTLYDSGSKILWTPNGLFVSGVTSLGADRAQMDIMLNDSFNVRWMTAHERFHSDEHPLDAVLTEDGILTVGYSQAINNFGYNPGGGGALLLKLPFDGQINFHPASHCITKYLQPSIYDSKNGGELVGLPTPEHGYGGTAPVVLTAQPQLTTNALPPPALVNITIPPSGWVPLEAGNANLPMTYDEWAAYNRIPTNSPPSADLDGDGRSNGEEYVFGGDPYSDQNGLPSFTMTRTNGTLSFSITRSHTSSGLTQLIETSTDLTDNDWDPVVPGTLTTSPLDAFTDQIGFALPVLNEPKRFYRVSAEWDED